MKKDIFIHILFFILVQSSCSQKKNATLDDIVAADSAELVEKEIDIKKSPLPWTNPNFEYSTFISNAQLGFFGHSLPQRFFKDKEGREWIAGWENLVNFSIDKDCTFKYYYYEILVESALANLKQSRFGDAYISPNDYYDSIGKSIVKKEVNNELAQNGVIFETNDIHLYFKGNRQDSIVVYQASIRNVFDKEIELKSIVINLGSKPADRVMGNLIIKEKAGLKDTSTLNEYTYQNINFLEKTLAPYSLQMIKKSLPNKQSTKNVALRFYNDNWEFTTCQISKSNEQIELKDK